MIRRKLVVTTVVAATLFGLVGCGTVPKADLEKMVADGLQKSVGKRPDKIDCPKDIPAKVGATERCKLTDAGTSIGLTVKVTSVSGGKAHIEIRVDDAK